MRTGDALDLVAVADAVRSVPNRVKLAQPCSDNTQSQLPNDAFQQAIELCQGRHFSYRPGLATGLPPCMGAGSLPCALRSLPPLIQPSGRDHLRKLLSILTYRWIHLARTGKQRSCHLIVKQLSRVQTVLASLTIQDNPICRGQPNEIRTGMQRTGLACPVLFRFVQSCISPKIQGWD